MTGKFKVEIHLVGGHVISAEVDPGDLEALKRVNPGVVLPPGISDHEAAGRIILSSLVFRMDKGSGLYMLQDTQGRHWIVSGASIQAANVTGFEDDETPSQIGFVNRDRVRASGDT